MDIIIVYFVYLEKKMKIKAVFFDLDGTLLPMDQDVFVKGYFHGLVGLLAPKGYDARGVGGALLRGIDAMVKNDGSKTNEQVFWDSFAAVLGEGVREETELLDEFYHTDFQKLSTLCGYTEMAKALVDMLNDRGITTVLATNPLFPSIATESRMRWAGLSPSDFKIYTTYEGSRYCKPNLKYYEELVSEIGLAPEECLMVGNDVSDDMVAENLGMKVFLLTDCLINNTDRSVEEFSHGNFDDLKKYIEELI